MYLSTVCDPQVLLDGGRWPNCMCGASTLNWLFACSKSTWECRDFRSSKQELILVQIWVVLILSHIMYALRERIATAADCEPFEVSVPRHGRAATQTLQQLRAPARAACPRGASTWPVACESTSRPHHTPGRAFVLPVSSARSAQTTTRASSSGSACASS
jgi:hypothetical protein